MPPRKGSRRGRAALPGTGLPVVIVPVELLGVAQGSRDTPHILYRARVTNTFTELNAFFISAEDSVALALGALTVLQFILVALRAYFMMEPMIQVLVYFLTHIDITLLHQLIMLILHVNHHVASLIRQRGASDALHTNAPHSAHFQPVRRSSIILILVIRQFPQRFIGTPSSHRQARADFP